MSPHRTERTRQEDGSRRARFLVWWAKWRDPIFAVVLLPTAVVAVWAGLSQRADEQATSKLTREQCQRSLILGPSLARDYEKRGVLTGEALALYRSLIPKTCPK